MESRPSVIHVARSLLQRQKQQQQQQQQQGGRLENGASPAELGDSQSLQQQELLALTAGDIAGLCFLQRSAATNVLPYEPLDPFAMDSALRVPQSDPKSVEQRLMALRDANQIAHADCLILHERRSRATLQ
jgi:hypothetical protein